VHQTTRRRPTGPTAIAPRLALLVVAALAACTGQPTVRGERPDGADRGQTFSRVLVVGISPNINQRCAFEFFLASQLRSESTEAIASCDEVKQKDPLTRESIEGAVASMQADAVVATSLVDREWSAEEGKGRDDRGGGAYKATDAGYVTGYYGVYGVPVIYGEFQTARPITTVEGEATVVTKVFETRGATPVYTVRTTARNLEARDTGLAKLTEAIADRLRREKLVR
jgi:hypothetical protein